LARRFWQKFLSEKLAGKAFKVIDRKNPSLLSKYLLSDGVLKEAREP
jgi:hypothetical protein